MYSNRDCTTCPDNKRCGLLAIFMAQHGRRVLGRLSPNCLLCTNNRTSNCPSCVHTHVCHFSFNTQKMEIVKQMVQDVKAGGQRR